MKNAATKAKKVKKEEFEVISTYEFGRRVKVIREDLLKLKQSEFATEIGTIQGVVSRLEHGIGGNTLAVFRIINYLNSKGYYGGMIFKEPFNINNLIKPNDAKDKAALKEKIEKTIAELKVSNEKALTNLLSLLTRL